MLLVARRRRFCQNCGAVVAAESEASCPECGLFAPTVNGEPWKRIRVRENGEATR